MVDATELTRRAMLAVGGAGALALAACSPGNQVEAPEPTTDTDDLPATTTPPDDGAGATGGDIAALADVPVGGSVGLEIDGEPALLAQPEAGQVVAFSAICTHQQCVVAAAGERFECPCHGSAFDAATGDVLQGPALEPLTPIAVRVAGDRIVSGA